LNQHWPFKGTDEKKLRERAQNVIEVGTSEGDVVCVSVDDGGQYFTGRVKVTPEKALSEVQRAWQLHCNKPPSDADIDLERVIALASEATKFSTLERWLRAMPSQGYKGLRLRRYKITIPPEWWPILLKVMAKQKATIEAVVDYCFAQQDEFYEVLCKISGEDKPIEGIYGTAAKGGKQ
jgi:hypothetical protein